MCLFQTVEDSVVVKLTTTAVKLTVVEIGRPSAQNRTNKTAELFPLRVLYSSHTRPSGRVGLQWGSPNDRRKKDALSGRCTVLVFKVF